MEFHQLDIAEKSSRIDFAGASGVDISSTTL